jgi:hypothetical protein
MREVTMKRHDLCLLLALAMALSTVVGHAGSQAVRAADKPSAKAPDAVVARVSISNLEADANPGPLGIDYATPTRMWQLSGKGRGATQTRYRVLVASTFALAAARRGDLWDTGPVASDTTSVICSAKSLASRTRYYWTVEVTTKDASAWAPVAWFETASLTAGEWQGIWISGPPRYTARITAAQGVADDSCCVAFNTTLHEAAPADSTNIEVASIPANTTATIYRPSADPSKVTESGVLASRAPGVTRVGNTLDAVRCAVGLGTYHFSTRGTATTGGRGMLAGELHNSSASGNRR